MTIPATFVATLVDEWVRAGVTDAVVAPGSRSTPLTLGVDGQLRVHVCLDERSAGFFALGLGLESGRPAVVITTSGSAAGHLLPAVMEAHHSCVPMLVCTADRPAELQDIGAPQTTDQTRLFDGFTRWAASTGPDLPAEAWRPLAARARAAAGAGPVHLNLQFREPLVGEADELPPGRVDGRPWHMPARAAVQTVDVSRFAGQRGVIVATGGGDVRGLGCRLGWPVLAGPMSHSRRPADDVVVVSAFDGILRHLGAQLAPEVIVTVGGFPASKVTNTWIEASGAELLCFDPLGRWLDPTRRASSVLAGTPTVADGVARAPEKWSTTWASAEAAAQAAIDATLGGHPEITEPGVARLLTATQPRLFAASSMPIRDVEWFGDPHGSGRVLANRGLNGIDGMVSTALGAASTAGWWAAGGEPPSTFTALLGDLAFLHEAGGLLGAAARGINCLFVVIDNDGGGIFSFLPQKATLPDVTFERYFATPHGIDVSAVAEAYGVPSVVVDSMTSLGDAVPGSGVRVVVARSDRARNVQVHEELNAAIGEAL